MNPKFIIALVASVLLLATSTTLLVCDRLLTSDKVEVMHDQLIIAESKLESRTDDYNRLLEKVGGSDVPFTPYIHPPTGKVGDK